MTEELLAAISARAAEIEAARRLPPDLVDALVAVGCFRVLLPASHGGLESDLPTALRLFESLARADASVGWTVMIGAAAWLDTTGLPRATFDKVFAPGADTIVAGAISPSGSIEAVDGGYRVTGRWGFASGCQHADWLMGNCVEGVVDGVPQLRMALFEPGQVVIEDTWRVVGLCGTGSHHFRADDVLLPAERTWTPFAGEPCVDMTLVRLGVPALGPLAIASVAVGAASGALDDVLALAGNKVPLLSPTTVAASPAFQYELAEASTTLRAARSLLTSTAEAIWASAARGPLSLQERADVRATGVWVLDRAVEVAEAAYRAGGGGAVYLDSPLQRRLRDLHAMTQHFLVRRDTLVTAGAVMAGQEISVPVF